jgi:enoyl-CoA hydratase
MILYETRPDGIAILTFNRPHAHNALDMATMHEFSESIAGLVEDESTHVLILTGAGDSAFCSGGDLNDLSQRPAAEDGLAMVTLMGDALLNIERLTIPVIAAVNGYALGGGSEIALACDMRIVDERVQFGLVHIRRGLIPGWGGGQRLLRLVGYARAMELLLEGRVLSSDDLLALGMVNKVAPPGGALEGALEIAGRIAQADVAAVRAVKQLLQAGLHEPYQTALQIERWLFPSQWTGATHQQAMQKFLGRRGNR